MKFVAMLAALGVLTAALPLEAAAQKRQPSPVYYGMKNPPKGIKKPRSVAQKQAQKKATKAATAKMKRSGPSTKQKAAQRKATKASAVKARAKPKKRRG